MRRSWLPAPLLAHPLASVQVVSSGEAVCLVVLLKLEAATSGWRQGERGSRASGTLLGLGGGLGHS